MRMPPLIGLPRVFFRFTRLPLRKERLELFRLILLRLICVNRLLYQSQSVIGSVKSRSALGELGSCVLDSIIERLSNDVHGLPPVMACFFGFLSPIPVEVK